MHLRDMYDEEEIPTRPDTPRATARRCKSCGMVYGDHAIARPPGLRGLQVRAACAGLRRNFVPEERSDADAER